MVTYEKLLNARDIMNDLAVTKLPPRLSLKLARSLRVYFDALNDLDEVRKGLLRNYAKLDKNGKPTFETKGDKEGQPKWKDQEGFKRDMREALDTESEINFSPLKLKHFPKPVEFTPIEALSLAEAGIVESEPEA